MIIAKVPNGVDADTIVEDINLNEKYIHAEVKYIGWANSKCYECGEDEPEFELEYVYGVCDK